MHNKFITQLICKNIFLFSCVFQRTTTLHSNNLNPTTLILTAPTITTMTSKTITAAAAVSYRNGEDFSVQVGDISRGAGSSDYVKCLKMVDNCRSSQLS